MENFTLIDFHRTRDFSRKMNATVEFVKQNFKPLTKSILVIAGPPILIASAMIGSMMSTLMDFSTLGMAGGGDGEAMLQKFTSVSFWLELMLIFFFFLISTVTTIATINNYIILYEEKRTNQIDVKDVWERVRETFFMYLGTVFLISLALIAAYAVVALLFVGMATVSGFFVFFGVVGSIIAFIYLPVACSLIFFIRGYEKAGFLEALIRSITLTRGKWWSTFGLLMVLYLIVMTVSYIFMIPYYAMMITKMVHSVTETAVAEPDSSSGILSIVFFTLYYLAQMILYSLPNVGLAFQYFNLVERKEARGLIGQIESIGQTPATSTSQDEQY
jgi:hypothetical protein